jgi:hypothetical protein
MIARRLPRVYERMVVLDPSHQLPILMSTEWFLCLYCRSLPAETSFRVWDCFFYEGVKALFRIGLGLLKLCEGALLECTSSIQLFGVINDTNKSLFDADLLIRTAYDVGRGLSRAYIEEVRQAHRKE